MIDSVKVNNIVYKINDTEARQEIEKKQDVTSDDLQTDNKNIVTAINEVNSLAKLCNKAKGYTDYETFINELNDASATDYNVGQSFLIQTLNVPDLWIISIEETNVSYTYTTDDAFIEATQVSGGKQVGYYKIGQLETLKQDLTNYVKNTDYATNYSTGVVRGNKDYGIRINSANGIMSIASSTNEEIDEKTNIYKPIVPANLDYAVSKAVESDTVKTSLSTQGFLTLETLPKYDGGVE